MADDATRARRAVGGVPLRAALTMPPTTPFRVAASMLHDEGHRWAVVIDDQCHPIGIFSETDAFRLLASTPADAGGRAGVVGDVMSSPVRTVAADDALEDARALMVDHELRRVPVVDDDHRLLGVITFLDLLRAQTEHLRRERDRLDRLVFERTRELEAANRHLASLSHEDALLGIGNRRAMDTFLAHVHALSRRQREPYGLLLVDVDLFKQYNDAYGHPGGDQTLLTIASVLSASLRASDRIFRYGGEEFLAVLPSTATTGVRTVATRALDAVRGHALPHERSPFGVLTVSAGGTAVDGTVEDSWIAGLRRADEALYRAKRDGRNRTHVVGSAP